MKLTLYYFSIPFWRAEVTRISLFINNIDFVDYRIKDEDYKKFKNNGELPNKKIAPFRQLPVLEVDGQIIAQTNAIARFCGKISGMYPKNNQINAAKIDQILDAAQDINYAVSITNKEKDPDLKKQAREKLSNVHLPRWFKFLETILIENKESEWFVGKKMTIADLAIWRLLGWLSSGLLEHVPANILDDFKEITKMRKSVSNNPKIKEWMIIKYGKELN